MTVIRGEDCCEYASILVEPSDIVMMTEGETLEVSGVLAGSWKFATWNQLGNRLLRPRMVRTSCVSRFAVVHFSISSVSLLVLDDAAYVV